jgi:hypothetical protein
VVTLFESCVIAFSVYSLYFFIRFNLSKRVSRIILMSLMVNPNDPILQWIFIRWRPSDFILWSMNFSPTRYIKTLVAEYMMANGMIDRTMLPKEFQELPEEKKEGEEIK